LDYRRVLGLVLCGDDAGWRTSFSTRVINVTSQVQSQSGAQMNACWLNSPRSTSGRRLRRWDDTYRFVVVRNPDYIQDNSARRHSLKTGSAM
jgi:hypothetical protein